MATSTTTCRYGHPLTPDNLYREPGRGKDRCRTCRRNTNLRHRDHPPAGETHLRGMVTRTPTSRDDWKPTGRCTNADPDQFIPRDGETGIPARARTAAAAYCAHCPVIAQCDTYATANRDIGLWAGRWRDLNCNRNQYRIRDLI